jgi:hypothetical protein
MTSKATFALRGFECTSLLVTMLMFSCFATAPKYRPPKPNTCRIVTFQEEGSSQVMASVSVSNDQELAGLTLPFRYGDGNSPIRCDSISFSDTRVEYFELKTQRIDSVEQVILLGLIPDFVGKKPSLERGYGEVARVYFTLKRGPRFPNYYLDTTTVKPFNRLKFVTSGVSGIYPAFDNKEAMIRGGLPMQPRVEEEAETEEKTGGESSAKE